ncbi:MAG: AMP-binding protein [Burkholderiales bacterium]|nr:AMP-binding protein [Burkholderiales bacterium]
MNIPDLLSQGVARWPDRTCVAEGDRSLTFREVDARADRLVQAFCARGLQPGDRIALLALSELEYLEIQVAAQRAGVVLVPLNFRLSGRELATVVSDCEPRLLIHGQEFGDAAAALDVSSTWHLGAAGFGEAYDAVLAEFAPGAGRAYLDSSKACLIVYTSGTTGRSKGAVISNGAFWARLNLCSVEFPAHAHDRLLFPIPMFHVSSSIAYAFVYRGCPIVQMRSFDLDGAIRLLEERPISHAVLVPTIIQRLAVRLEAEPRPLAALRLVIYGGSAIAPAALRHAMDVLGCEFAQVYGLTEGLNATVLRTSRIDVERHPERLGSAGTPAISYDVKVVDAGGGEVPPGEVGEIIVRGPCLMERYWNAPEATAEALRDGWLHTGDLGRLSEDGYLFVTDRVKDMIVSGGENVYAREVEDAFYEHRDVLEVAVFGIPSETWGEVVHAMVVGREGARLEPDELIRHCRERLAHYKVPRSIEITDSLKKNATGKILKRDLRAPYWQGRDRAIG